MTNLWSGIDIKIQHAHFFLDKMGRALVPPERTQWSAALDSSGTIRGFNWQSIYAYLDAFLGITRSVPEVVNCCFGHDTSPKMATWFDKLPPEEQTRRRNFSNQFRADRQRFLDHALSNERNVSLHRTGIPSVVVAHTGFFGVTYVGGPSNPIPLTETRPLPEGDPHAWVAKPIQVTPSWKDFTIDGKPLFDES
ncbi:MAG: hypothetical protein WAM77_25880, partial [Xanthobacteraceae bacterium]